MEDNKICISSTGRDLNADVDPRFGRCNYFLVINPDNKEYELIVNESQNEMGGAGIKAAETIAKNNVKYVITGNVGPNAFQTLQAAGIKVISGVSGNIMEVIDRFNNGELKEIKNPTVGSHFGMKFKGGNIK
jgi:predicted Fe-Mo cluster-binding NifX family protein